MAVTNDQNIKPITITSKILNASGFALPGEKGNKVIKVIKQAMSIFGWQGRNERPSKSFYLQLSIICASQILTN